MADLREAVTIAEAVAFLNDLVAIDSPAITALMMNRVPCNQAMAEHPTVQVLQKDDAFYVGMLGIINGLFGTHENGFGPITFVFSDDELQSVRQTSLEA